MNEKELKDELMRGAKTGGICARGYGLMRGYDREELIDYYLANPDWCIERGFPSMEMLKREFGDIEDRGVYVGKKFAGEVLDKRQVYVFHGCKGTIRVAMDYDIGVIPMLYFANGCRMRVESGQRNVPAIRVPLYIGEGCEIEAQDEQGVKFRRHGIARCTMHNQPD